MRGLQNSTRVWRGNIGRQIAKVRRGALLARRSHDGILAARQADVTLTVHGQRPVSSALPAAVVYLGQLARGDKVGDFVGTRTDHLCCPFSLFDGMYKTETVYRFLHYIEISWGRGQRNRKRMVWAYSARLSAWLILRLRSHNNQSKESNQHA